MSNEERVSIPLSRYDELCDKAAQAQRLQRQLDTIREAFRSIKHALENSGVNEELL